MKTATLLIKGRNNVLSKCKQALFQCLNYLGNLGLKDQSRHAQVGKSCIMFQGQILANIRLSGQGFWAGFSSRAGGLLARHDKNGSAALLPLCHGCRLKQLPQMLPTLLGLGLKVTKHLFSACTSEPVLSQFILSSVCCGHNHLHTLLTVPQVPMNFCTFSLMFKVISLHWTAGKTGSKQPAAMSRAAEPHFPSCSDQDFPSNLSPALCVLWLTGTGHWKAVLAKGSHILLSHCWQCFTGPSVWSCAAAVMLILFLHVCFLYFQGWHWPDPLSSHSGAHPVHCGLEPESTNISLALIYRKQHKND